MPMATMGRIKPPRALARRRAYDRGLWAERLAAALLVVKGYRILAHRCKTALGEIDLIAKKGATLVFVEVKYRKNRAQAAAALNARQRDRVGRAAQLFLSGRPDLAPLDQRFDVIMVYPWKFIQHIKNYWQPTSK